MKKCKKNLAVVGFEPTPSKCTLYRMCVCGAGRGILSEKVKKTLAVVGFEPTPLKCILNRMCLWGWKRDFR